MCIRANKILCDYKCGPSLNDVSGAADPGVGLVIECRLKITRLPEEVVLLMAIASWMVLNGRQRAWQLAVMFALIILYELYLKQ